MAGSSNQERQIFIAALERPTPAERAAYLDGACGDDAELRAKVGELLSAHELAGGFLARDDPVPLGADSAKEFGANFGVLPVSEKPGDRIGRYKLLEKVGEGGCGVVYVAEQEQPLRRRIALKVIKLGMDTKAIVARFEAERQALAMMDHPNIAKVFEAGATETGRPYFVMELVRGVKITDYCDQNRLSIRERLDLFIKVCQAIQHAHQKGIIHRDIKPSNILVTLHDGVPVPKIIDFGIAKATGGRLTDLTVYTDLHQFIGTPAYMSPEQAEMSGLDIDTRTDIYSLGVLLYELLTGLTPFDAKALMQSGLDAMRKTIRETEPLRPSTRLSTMVHAQLTTVAQQHDAEAPRLIHLVRGDLDWIVMKALEKDRRRRYETANGLAMDVQRHLDHEPIVARPQSPAYRLQKLVQRNRLGVTAAAAVAAALAAGMIGVFWQWRQAVRNHQEAEANLYAADMNRAAQVLEDLGPVAARGLLARHKEQDQLHGFEWRYLWKQCLGDAAYTFPSHSNNLWKVVFSPDDSTVAALEESGSLRLLTLSTRTASTCLSNVTGLAGFLTNGHELILSSLIGEGHRLMRFDLRTGENVILPPEPGQFGWLPSLLADGSVAIVPGKKNDLLLVDTQTGKVTAQTAIPDACFPCYEAFAESCAVSRDGRWMFVLTNGRASGTVATLSVQEVASGRILATYRDAAPGSPQIVIGDRVYVLRFLPDATTVVWASHDGYLHRWHWTEPGSDPHAEQGHRGIVWDLACSPDGRRLATAGEDQTIRIWDATSLTQLRVLRGHRHRVFSVAFSHNGRWLASGGEEGTIKLWNLEGGKSSGEVPVVVARQLANRITFARDSHVLAVGTDDNDAISIINTDTAEVTACFTNLFFPARFLPDGVRIVGMGGVGNLAKGKVERAIDLSDLAYPWAHDVSPDGRWLVLGYRSAAQKADTSEAFDLQYGSVISNSLPNSGAVAVQFTRDGRTLLVWDVKCQLDWWTVTTEGFKQERSVAVGYFGRALALSPDGTEIALGGLSRLTLVDYRSGAIRHGLFGHAHDITGLAYAPEGDTLASCSVDGTIKLWNLRTMQEVCTIVFDTKSAMGKEIGVQGVGFAPDGRSLWAFSRSGLLKYWRAATAEEIAGAAQASKP